MNGRQERCARDKTLVPLASGGPGKALSTPEAAGEPGAAHRSPRPPPRGGQPMPRTPTGNPRGRPTGTGRLGEQTRFTVKIPRELYQRLEAFAEGRRSTHGTPQLAGCVRDALAHYLVCPQRRQT